MIGRIEEQIFGAVLAQTGERWDWRMHDMMGLGWGGMGLGFLVMLAALALLIALIVGFIKLMSGERAPSTPTQRSARDVLDERYARGEIDREEYVKRREDLSR